MLIYQEQTTLKSTQQRVEFVWHGKEKGRTYVVIGSASDGTWMIKESGTSDWVYVDTQGECHNHYYQGRTRPVSELELKAYRQHQVELSQGMLF